MDLYVLWSYQYRNNKITYGWNSSFRNCSWPYASNSCRVIHNCVPSVPSWRSVKSLIIPWTFQVNDFLCLLLTKFSVHWDKKDSLSQENKHRLLYIFTSNLKPNNFKGSSTSYLSTHAPRFHWAFISSCYWCTSTSCFTRRMGTK